MSATETLIELGLGDKIVGMMNPDNEVTSIYKDSVANINKLGDKKTISKEIVLSALPDIIVGRAAMFSDKSLGEYTQWNANGVEVYAQAASVTKGETKIESVIQDVRNLGVIFNVQDKADSYADELQKKYDSAVYLLNGEQEGVNHGNLLEQAPVKAHMVHEHLMSVMNAVSIFDEYGHHENKPERINRLLSVLTGMEGSYENGGKETK